MFSICVLRGGRKEGRKEKEERGRKFLLSPCEGFFPMRSRHAFSELSLSTFWSHHTVQPNLSSTDDASSSTDVVFSTAGSGRGRF